MTKEPFDINLFGNKSTNNLPTIYDAPVNNKRIPERDYQSSTLGFAAKFVPTPIVQPDRTGLNTIVDQDHLSKQESLKTAIRTSFEADDGVDMDVKMEAATMALRVGSTASTPGQVFKNTNYPEKATDVGQTIDRKIFMDEHEATVLSHLGEEEGDMTLAQKLSEPNPSWTDEIANTLKSFSAESIAELTEFMPEGSATRQLVERFTNKESGAMTPFDDADAITSGLTQRLGEAVLPRLGMDKDASLNDMLEFVSFLPVDSDIELDTMGAIKDIVFSADTLQGRIDRLSAWDDQFRAKYGEEGYLQLSAFMVKEGVVDAAALALALKSPRLAGKLVAESRDKILTRMTKALGRASVMGVAGTGVQASIDSYLGFETDVPQELGLRVGGAFVGEGVAKAIMATGRGIAGAASRLIDKGATLVGHQGHTLASAGELTVAQVIQGNIPTSVGDKVLMDAMERLGLEDLKIQSLASSVTEAAVGSNTQPYRVLANQAVDAARKDQIGSLANIFDLNESEMTANMFGKTMKEEIMLHGVGNKLIGETVVKQTEADNVLNYYFDHGVKQLSRRPGELQGSTAPFRVNEWLSDGRNWVGDLADDLYDEHLNKDMYEKAFIDARNVIFKDLPKNANIKAATVREQLDELTSKNPTMIVDDTTLDRMGLNALEKDAYWAQGKLMDFAAIVAEHNMIKNYTAKGYKQLPDGRKVKVVEAGESSRVQLPRATKAARYSKIPSISKILKDGGEPRFHDTSAKGLLGILDEGSINPSKVRFQDKPTISIGRDFHNFSRYEASPYRLVLNRRNLEEKSQPFDMLSGGREESEEVLSKAVKSTAIESLLIDISSPHAAADLKSGVLAKVLAKANKKGVKVEYYEGKTRLLDESLHTDARAAFEEAGLVGGKSTPAAEVLEKEGMTKVREEGLNQPIIEVPTGDIKDVYRVMGYRKHHVPRYYKDANYLSGVLDLNTGKLEVAWASRHKSEMDEFMLKQDSELAGTNKVAMYWRNGTDEKSLNFGMSNSSLSVVDNLDEAGLAKLREALSASGNKELAEADMEGLRLAFDTMTHGSLASQQIAGKRGAQGLKTVTGEPFEYLPAPEAITQHLMEVSALSYRDFRNDAIRKFEKEFADVLDNTQNWDQPIKNTLGNSDRVQRALSVQGFLKRNVFNETPYGKEFRRGVDAMADRMRKAGGAQAAMVKGVETSPIAKIGMDLTRGGSTFMMKAPSFFVFAGNFGSFVTQVASSLAITIGAKGLTAPTHLVAGFTHMMGAMAASSAKHGKVSSKDANKALQALMKSGVISKEDFGDVSRVAYSQASTLYSKGMFLIQKGENVNKASVWFVIRAEMMDKARKGKLMNLANTRLLDVKDIDSTEFLQIVSQKAKILHQDMTAAGRLRALTGVGEVVGKFTAPIIKMHTMFVSPSLSKAEKMGAATGMLAFYGLPAIPAYLTIISTADWVASKIAGEDEIGDFDIVTRASQNLGEHLLDGLDELAGFTEEDKEFFRNTISKGLIYSLSEGELDLVNKVNIGLFIADSTKYIEDPIQAIPMISILNKAAESASNIVGMLEDIAYSLTSEETEDQKIIDLRTFIGEVMDETGNALPGFGKFADILNNSPDTRKYLKPELANKDPNGWVTRSGKRIKTDYEPTGMEKMLNVFGIAPKPVQENREVLKGQFDRVDILKKMKADWVAQYKSAGTESARHRIRKDALLAAKDAEQALSATYVGALSQAIGQGASNRYTRGSLWDNWLYSMKRVDQEKIAGNRTRSKGE